MPFRLSQHTLLSDDLRRLADAELGAAIDRLRDHASAPDPRVHGARKSVKRVRALLRLARAGLPKPRFRAHNLALRDAARGLSAARDAAVALATFDRLVPADDPLAALRPALIARTSPTAAPPRTPDLTTTATTDPTTDPTTTTATTDPTTDPTTTTATTDPTTAATTDPTTAATTDPTTTATTTATTDPTTATTDPTTTPEDPPVDLLGAAAAALAPVRAALQVDLDRLRFADLAAGLKDSYAGGRAAMRAARAVNDPDDETFHAWRKRAKDLWYQCQLLQGACPPLLGALETMLDELGERLGDDHDLAVLQAVLPDNDALRQRIAARHVELRDAAWRVGQRIYAERPRAFVRRVRTYWQTWRAEATTA